MRFLFCSLASPGFVYSAIGIAKELCRRGHQAAFVTGPDFTSTLAEQDLARIPRGDKDGNSFEVYHWFKPLSVAIQVKHIEYALKVFAPDILVGQQLTYGPLIVGERVGVPVASIGLAAYMWPRWPAGHNAMTEIEECLLGRYNDMIGFYNEARALFGLARRDEHHLENPLLADTFLLQSIPELEKDTFPLPARVQFVGSCGWEPAACDDELTQWLDSAILSKAPIIYAQLGRAFERESCWPALVAAFAEKPLKVVADVGRMDCELGDIPANFFVKGYIPQGQVLPYVDATISSGHTTAALGSLAHGLPSLLLPTGSGTEVIARNYCRAGVSICLQPSEVSPTALTAAVAELLNNRRLHDNARLLKAALARINGCEHAADLLEQLVAAPSLL